MQHIVEALAKTDPRDECGYCTLCGEFVTSKKRVDNDYPNAPELHKTDCPFRMAAEAIGVTA